MLTKTQDKTFKWILAALTFLALGTIVSPTIVSLYHILIIVPAIIVYARREYPVKVPLSSWFLIALFVWGVVATVYNLDTVVKPRKSFDDLKFYLLGFGLIVPLRYALDRASSYQLKRLLNIFFLTLIVAFFVGISKAWFGFDLVTLKSGDFHPRSGGFTNYMRYGYASAFIVIFSLGMWINRTKLTEFLSPKFFYPAAFLSLAAIGTSQTRGAVLALLIGLPWLFLRYRPKLASGLIGVGAIFASIIVYFSFFSSSQYRFIDISDASNNVRMSQFYSAVKTIEERPFIGLGSNQFSRNVTRIKEEHDIWAKDYVGHAHNIILEHAANFGIPGAILMLAFFAAWFFEMIKLGNFGWVFSAYILAFLAAGQVENLFDNTNSHLLFFAYSFSQAWRFR